MDLRSSGTVVLSAEELTWRGKRGKGEWSGRGGERGGSKVREGGGEWKTKRKAEWRREDVDWKN